MDARRSGSGGVVFAAVNALEEALIALLLAAMVVVTLYRLAMAALPDTVPTGVPDISPYLFTWLVLLGMSYAVKVNAHLAVDAFVNLFGPGPRRVFGLLTVIAGLTYGGLLLVGAWEHLAGLYQLGTEADGLGIPQWQLLAILPIGLALLLFRLAQAGMRIWTRRQEGLLNGDEAAAALNRHLETVARGVAVEPAPRGGAKRP